LVFMEEAWVVSHRPWGDGGQALLLVECHRHQFGGLDGLRWEWLKHG